ncbi:MAG: low temperature requirement protein A [Alphaproteobacteria bacterium]|nr:low temperature requirement protein A [Alphaproteobacteria bacterium]
MADDPVIDDPGLSPDNMLRARTGKHHGRVGFAELFFDLVFVFAVTQISHFLVDHPSVWGAMQALLLLLAVWTVWMWTTWATNWLDSDRAGPRLMLFALMAGGLVLSASIAEAFDTRGATFAMAYVLMQAGRSIFVVLALRAGHENERRNFQRIFVWTFFSGVFWISGGFAEPEARGAFWIVAIILDLVGPWVRFPTPGLGRSSISDWAVDTEHMSERVALFIIIALGESIIVTGTKFVELDWTAQNWLGFISALSGAISMWWIYFAISAEEARKAFDRHDRPGEIARAAYTFAHLPIVAGIIVAAVSHELVLAHPLDANTTFGVTTTLLGPAFFLAGVATFCWLVFSQVPTSALTGLGFLMVLLFVSPYLPPVALSLATTAVLILIGVWETVRNLRRPAHFGLDPPPTSPRSSTRPP